MRGCEQARGLNMLQHGELVHQKYLELLQALGAGSADPLLQAIFARHQHHLLPPALLRRYHVYHDCGKHLARATDETGRVHFPDHARLSSLQYAHLFPADAIVIELIRRDMDFHVLRGEELERLCRSPFAPTLYLTAWAELEANASMFGGHESESYKIKRSRLIKAGKKLLNLPKGASK